MSLSYPWEINQKTKPNWICRTRIFFFSASLLLCIYSYTYLKKNHICVYTYYKLSVIASITTVAVILAISTKCSHNDILNLTTLTFLISLGNTMARRKICQATAKCRILHNYLRVICFKKSCKKNDKEVRATLPNRTREHPRAEGHPWGC